MIFPYVRYEVDPTAAIPSGIIHRPLIPIRLIGRTGVVEVFGLLDTGADHVFVSASLAQVLGVDISGPAESALGAAGHEVETRSGSLEIQIAQGAESYRWLTAVGFLVGDDDPPITYLGRAGFLEYFHATFDGEAQTVELIPNAHLIGRV
jgi:hypothetical protein